MTNEEFIQLCQKESKYVHAGFAGDIYHMMKKHNLIVMKNPEAKQETATMTTEMTLEEKLANEALRVYSTEGVMLGAGPSFTQAIKNLNLKVIPAPKNPHKHFDLAVEAYGDTTIEWQSKFAGNPDSLYTDMNSMPSFRNNLDYRKKPKTLRFRNYKYVDDVGVTRISQLYSNENYDISVRDCDWIGDWQEIEI